MREMIEAILGYIRLYTKVVERDISIFYLLREREKKERKEERNER